MPCVLQGSTDAPANQTIEQPSLETDLSLIEPQIQQITEVAWVDDDVEYVGLNDEDPISDSSEFEPDSDIDYMKKTCNEYVYESDAPPPAPPKPKRKRAKKNVTVVPSSSATNPIQEQPSLDESL